MIIYKQDTKGNIRYIKATATIEGKLIQESGIVGTESPIEHVKQCKGKNVGRANETTASQQAIKERDSLIAEKLKKEYFKTQKEAKENEVVLPMLAHKYKDHAKKIDWTHAFVQPKLDGMRATGGGKHKLTSREGEIMQTVPHITEVLSKIPLHLDGELYGHGLSFQENMSLIKKNQPGESEKIHYHVYDCIWGHAGFNARYYTLKTIIEGYKDVHKGLIELVPTYQIKNEAELKKYHKQFLSEGYEGTILRWGDAPYMINGRSQNLLKFKDFIDKAYKILDIVPCTQRPEWGKPVFEEVNGKKFESGMKYSHAERKDFLANKERYIGKIAEVRFFEYTDGGIPRFPVMYGIRLDKKKQDK